MASKAKPQIWLPESLIRSLIKSGWNDAMICELLDTMLREQVVECIHRLRDAPTPE